MQLRLTAPAKINLGLDVLDKRSDGYHNIQTVMQTISLYDYIVIRPADKGIRLECDSPGIPAGEENLAYQAARLILGRAGSQQSVCIYLKKGIPPAAGLGGGSSDAATVLKGINTIMGLHLSEGELIDMGGTIGADVPFFISGGTAFAQGKGDKLTQLTSFKGMDILLIKPHFELSTASVYHQFDSCRPEKRPDMNSILEAVRNKDMDSLGKRIYNVLEGSLGDKMEYILNLKSLLMEAGALGASMSGSGSAVYGIFADQSGALQAYRDLRDKVWEIYILKTM